MKIIAIEGLDKAGKHTATSVLQSFFESVGLSVVPYSFPNYETPIGKLVRDWLEGKLEASHATFELLQAADKHDGQRMIDLFDDMGVDVLLIDRYVHSQLAYGSVSNDKAWVRSLVTGVREPDAVVFLDVEPEVSMHRRGKFEVNDRYESDLGRLRATRAAYVELFESETTPVIRLDANQPQLLVKADLFGAAKELIDLLGLETVDAETEPLHHT